jgi:hypothetical protein
MSDIEQKKKKKINNKFEKNENMMLNSLRTFPGTNSTDDI